MTSSISRPSFVLAVSGAELADRVPCLLNRILPDVTVACTSLETAAEPASARFVMKESLVVGSRAIVSYADRTVRFQVLIDHVARCTVPEKCDTLLFPDEETGLNSIASFLKVSAHILRIAHPNPDGHVGMIQIHYFRGVKRSPPRFVRVPGHKGEFALYPLPKYGRGFGRFTSTCHVVMEHLCREPHLRALAESGCSLIVTMLNDAEFASAGVLVSESITRVHIPCQG